MVKLKKMNLSNLEKVSDGLKVLYNTVLLPLEENYKFHQLQAPKMSSSDFESVPIILLIGQYSTGKTSFIRYLLNCDYTGMRIGPEPTTDGFVAIMGGQKNTVIPGNALAVDGSKQFSSLSSFGNNFLKRFNASVMDNETLRAVTLVDTPGILSGDKQTVSRGYDFVGVVKWFAERADTILILFDSHKLDISDEFKQVIEVLKYYDTKIKLVLNKADCVNPQQLMRVYGALMWSLGKVIHTPEVTRVYIGSFWDNPLQNDENRKLFELEQEDLLNDLRDLPKTCVLRKVNDFIKRTRAAIINAHIISYLQKEMPVFGKDKKKAELIKNLGTIFNTMTREMQLSIGDFPDIEDYQQKLQVMDFSKFNKMNSKLISVAKEMLETKIQQIIDLVPKENIDKSDSNELSGGVFSNLRAIKESDTANPFFLGAESVFSQGYSEEWPVTAFRKAYDEVFETLKKIDDKVTGPVARTELVKTKLPNSILGHVWALADVDRDGKLTRDEWALCCYLCDKKLEGQELPDSLPLHLVPPS